MDVQGAGEKFLSNVWHHSEIEIAPGFDFSSVYFVGVNNVFLKECGLQKCPCRPLTETEINLLKILRNRCDDRWNVCTIVKIRASVSREIRLKYSLRRGPCDCLSSNHARYSISEMILFWAKPLKVLGSFKNQFNVGAKAVKPWRPHLVMKCTLQNQFIMECVIPSHYLRCCLVNKAIAGNNLWPNTRNDMATNFCEPRFLTWDLKWTCQIG